MAIGLCVLAQTAKLHKEHRFLYVDVLRIRVTSARIQIRTEVVLFRGDPDLQHCSHLQHISPHI